MKKLEIKASIDGKDAVIALSPDEMKKVVDYYFAQRKAEEEERSKGLIDEAEKIAREAGACNTSLLQRKLHVGYGRAAMLIDELKERGVIGDDYKVKD